jgi:predicted CXXCH cytochrome family protein
VRCHSGVKLAASKPGAHKAMEKGCITCHTPHAADERGLIKAAGERERCLGCHQEMRKLFAASFSRHPVKADGGRCTACHAPHESDKKPLLKAERADLCKTCHQNHSQFAHPYGPNVLDPRTGQSMTCLSCHNPHATSYPSMLVANPSRALCVQCHNDTPEMEKHRRKTGVASATGAGAH